MNLLMRILILLSSLLLLFGCTTEGVPSKANSDNIKLIMDPSLPELNQDIHFTAHISTYDDYDVMRIVLELKKENKNYRELIDMEHQGDGVYTATKNFTSSDDYLIVVHLYAPGIHEWITQRLKL